MLRCKTIRALRVDKETYVRGICEGVEHHLWSCDSHLDYREIRSLCSSKPIHHCTTVRLEGGWLLTLEFEVKTCMAGYFEQLYQTDPSVVELGIRVLIFLLLALNSTVIHLRLWKRRLR